MNRQTSREDTSSYADRPSGLSRATLGGHRIGEELGGGAGSRVFAAVGADPSEPVAIKVFSVSTAGDRRSIERLRLSLRVLSQIDQPGIPRILAAGLTEGRPYIVMPYFGAGSLRDRLAMGLLGLADLQDVLNGLVPILSCAHSQGLLHGDLKPSEILFDDDGRMQIIGLGQTLYQPIAHSPATEHRHGAYTAPELLRGLLPTPSSDQYSLAVIALEMATGYDPEGILPSIHSLDGHRFHHATLQDEAGLYLPSRVIQVFRRATANNPSERFPSVVDMQAALIAALHDTPVPAAKPEIEPQADRPKRRKPRILLPLVATAFTAVLCLVTAIPALSSSNLTDFDLGRYAGVLIDALSTHDGGSPALDFSPTPTTLVADPDDTLGPTGDPALSIGGGDAEGLLSPQPSEIPADGHDTPAEPTQPSEPEADANPDRSVPTDEPSPATPTPAASTPTPEPSNTPVPTSMPTATPVTLEPTDIPPTDPGEEPTINPNKCKSDPGHKNYCTPVP